MLVIYAASIGLHSKAVSEAQVVCVSSVQNFGRPRALVMTCPRKRNVSHFKHTAAIVRAGVRRVPRSIITQRKPDVGWKWVPFDIITTPKDERGGNTRKVKWLALFVH